LCGVSSLGITIKLLSQIHNHEASAEIFHAQIVRHKILDKAERHPEATPAALLNENITADVALCLPGELALKKAVQRRRRVNRPKEPSSAADVNISGAWTETLDKKEWYVGVASVGDDKAYIFATEVNLIKLNVMLLFFMFHLLLFLM